MAIELTRLTRTEPMLRRPHWRISPFDCSQDVLPAAWQVLNERAMGAHPLLAPCFLHPLLRHFGHGELYLAELVKDGEHLALALLSKVNAFQWTLFQPSQAPLAPILLNPESVNPDAALEWLLEDLPGIPFQLALTALDPDYSPVPNPSPRNERIGHVTTMGVAAQVPFEEFWYSRSKKLRYQIRRSLRKLEGSGLNARFVAIRSTEGMDTALVQYGELESAGWKGRNGTAIHQSNIQGAAYLEIMNGFAQQQQALIHHMFVNSRLAASRLIVFGGSMAVILKTTHDETLSRFSPGRVHLYHVLEHLFSLPHLEKIEFYTNANQHQLRWGTFSRNIFHVNQYRNSSFRRILALRNYINEKFMTGRRRRDPIDAER